jgi:molybdopterin converting factor small subunit
VSVIRIPPTLRAETGGEREVIVEGQTVRDLLDDLTARFPGLNGRLEYANVYVGGEDIRTRDGYDTPVAESDTLILLPAMAGGCEGLSLGV